MSNQQMLLAGSLEGQPQSVGGGVNTTFASNGLMTITTGTLGSPTQWMNIAPQTGVGANFWIKFTFTSTASGTATGVGNSGWQQMTSGVLCTAVGGAGSVNYSWVIAASSGGATIASGTSVANNTI